MAGNTKKLTRCATHCLYYQPQKQANAPQKVQDPGLTHSLTHRPWQLVAVPKGTKKKNQTSPCSHGTHDLWESEGQGTT